METNSKKKMKLIFKEPFKRSLFESQSSIFYVDFIRDSMVQTLANQKYYQKNLIKLQGLDNKSILAQY